MRDRDQGGVQLVSRNSCHVFSINVDSARRNVDKKKETRQERTFTASSTAANAYSLAALKIKRHMVQD